MWVGAIPLPPAFALLQPHIHTHTHTVRNGFVRMCRCSCDQRYLTKKPTPPSTPVLRGTSANRPGVNGGRFGTGGGGARHALAEKKGVRWVLNNFCLASCVHPSPYKHTHTHSTSAHRLRASCQRTEGRGRRERVKCAGFGQSVVWLMDPGTVSNTHTHNS